MIVLVSCGINIERKCELSVSFQSSAFVIALERLLAISFTGLGSIASRFRLKMLAVTGNEHPVLARLVFATRRRSVTDFFTRMTARFLGFSTELLTRFPSVFAFAATVALISAEMRATF